MIQKIVSIDQTTTIVVVKAGAILLRSGNGKDEVWIPTQIRRTAFPLWNIGGVLREEDSEGGEVWAKVEDKMRDMVVYNFPEKTRATVELLEGAMAKVVRVQLDTIFAYFIGYVKVREEFDQQPQRQHSWIQKAKFMEMVRDG